MVDGRKDDEQNEPQKNNKNIENEYYSASEVAEMHKITRQAAIDRCKAGKYQGAIKTQPDRTNKQGLWLIPRQTIDNPNTEFVPASFQQQADLITLKNDFRQIVAEEYANHLTEIQRLHDQQIAFMQQQFEMQNQQNNEKIQQLQKEIQESYENNLKNRVNDQKLLLESADQINASIQQIIIETRVDRERKKKKWWSFNS